MRLSFFVLLFYSAWASKLATQPDPRLKLCESIHNFTWNSKFSWKEKYEGIPPSIKFSVTSEVPVEHETLKSGRDVTWRDATGRWTMDDRRRTTNDGWWRRWKDRCEDWNIYVDKISRSYIFFFLHVHQMALRSQMLMMTLRSQIL